MCDGSEVLFWVKVRERGSVEEVDMDEEKKKWRETNRKIEQERVVGLVECG